MQRIGLNKSIVVTAWILIAIIAVPFSAAKGRGKAQSAIRQDGPSGTTGEETGRDIKVHGHWTVLIRNEDGSVASRHEFNNALNDGSFLSKLLSREATVGPNSYAIFLNAGPGLVVHGDRICSVTNPLSNQAVPALCEITETSGSSNGSIFPGLTVTSVNGTLRLSGSARASNAGRIGFVTSALSVCVAGSCGDNFFTARDLTVAEPPSTTPPPPINVVAGQTIDVTVTISFS